MKQNLSLNSHEIIIFGVEHYNPLGVIRSLGENGIYPVFISLKGRWDIAEKSKYVKQVYRVDNHEQGLEIIFNNYGNSEQDKLPIIITCDDKTMEFLDKQYDKLKGRFILFNANGESGRITKYMNKFEILQMAQKNGLKILKSEIVDKGVVPCGLEYPIITKSMSPTIGGWKSDVFICYSEKELSEAYQKIRSPKVLLQKYIEKKNEYCIDGFSINHGRNTMITIEATYNYLISGYYSPYMTVKNYENSELEKGIKDLISEIGYEGIWCIEFLIDQEDNYYFTEMNFRNSGWSYASTKAGMNLPMSWVKSMLNGTIVEKDIYRKIQDGFTAMVEPIDYQKRVIERNVPLGEWLKDFKKCNCGFYYDDNDTEPFFEMVRNWERLN